MSWPTNRSKITKTYRIFSLAEGSKHIASEYAIKKILKIIRFFKIEIVLEIGLGIGSIAGCVFSKIKSINYSGTENNEFCLESLIKNLGEYYPQLEIYQELEYIPRTKKFQLIIIDGEEKSLNLLKNLITENGIIVIEGDRRSQLEYLNKFFPKNKMVHSISLKKNREYSPFSNLDWQGGLKIIFIDPNFLQYCWWLKEKLLTRSKFQFPGRFLGENKRSKVI